MKTKKTHLTDRRAREITSHNNKVARTDDPTIRTVDRVDHHAKAVLVRVAHVRVARVREARAVSAELRDLRVVHDPKVSLPEALVATSQAMSRSERAAIEVIEASEANEATIAVATGVAKADSEARDDVPMTRTRIMLSIVIRVRTKRKRLTNFSF